jgi:hypothetical protein
MYLNCRHKRAYCSSPGDRLYMESHGGMIFRGNTKELREKPVPV